MPKVFATWSTLSNTEKKGWREGGCEEAMERLDRKKSTARQRGKCIADEIQITFALLVMKPGWGEEEEQRKMCRVKSGVSSLTTQVNHGERQEGWWQVEMVKFRDKRQRWEQKRQRASSPCTLIAFTFEFRARLLWKCYKWGWGANSRQFYCNTNHNVWLRAN